MAEGHNTDIDLKCTICLSYYTEPRLLPCYHIFCTACLDKLITESETEYIVCPLCRTEINLPEEGIKGFELYSFYNKLPNKEPIENGGCQLCSEESFATAKCLDCQINLCSNCHDYHGKLKASQGHKLELFRNLNQESIVREKYKLEKDCDEHKLELSQFCKACNKLICTNCLEKYHTSHKTETLISSAKLKRDMLFTRIASLKSRIPIVENTVEVVKAMENNNYKRCNQVKKEMLSHAAVLKEVFCRMVDVLLKENVDRVDDISKKRVKCIRTYIDELENDKLSLLCFTRTVESLITQYSDPEILQHYLNVGQKLDEVLRKEVIGLSEINDFLYQRGTFDEKIVKASFGEIKNTVVPVGIKPNILSFHIPSLHPKAEMIHSFEHKNRILGMVPCDDDSVWILTSDSLSLHKSNGTVLTNEVPPKPNVQLLLRKSQNEIWYWAENHAIKRRTGVEGFKVPFKGGKSCCFINNGNLIVFNPNDKILYEVTENDGIKRKIENADLQNYLTLDNMFMTETQSFNFVITQKCSLIIIDNKGTIKDYNSYKNCTFSSICVDNYGNIIAGDLSVSEVYVFSEEANYLYSLLTMKENSITCPSDTIIDKLGNLWLVDKSKTVKIYSYI